MVKIIHRHTRAVLYAADVPYLGVATQLAVDAGVNLSEANLRGCDLKDTSLSGANMPEAALTRANLTDADLSGADLSGADLSKASLLGTNLSGANLSGADLSGTCLAEANLSEARLDGANLAAANLDRADLSGVDLSKANLSRIKADVFDMLDSCPSEVPGLREAIVEGRINGNYYDGVCCCLVGTLAKLRHVDAGCLPGRRADIRSPAERWALAIKPGHTPDNSQVSAITLGWIDEWLSVRAST